MNSGCWIWGVIALVAASVLAAVALSNSELRQQSPLQLDPEANALPGRVKGA
ncbi:MAG: hypothetical protein AB8E87_08570 [Prochlorococcus sp.]